MADQEKSPIFSSKITMSSSENKTDPKNKKKSFPWNILIFSDFGYSSENPEPIKASILNEFIESKNIFFRENVKSTYENRDIFIEYKIKSLMDFSKKKIRHNLQYTNDLQFLCDILFEVVQGTIDRETATNKIRDRKIVTSPFKDALALLKMKKNDDVVVQNKPISKPKNEEKGKALDNIFSSMDLTTDPEENTTDTTKPALDNLVSSISSEFTVSLPKTQINSLIERCKKQIDEQIREFQNNNIFKQYKSSWLCIRHLTKILGRNRDCNLFIHSTPISKHPDSLINTLSKLSDQGRTPDIILFDYPLTFSTAHMELLSTISNTADSIKSMVLSHCGLEETIINDFQNIDTLKPILKEQRFIPLNRLRKNESSRCTVLTIPPIVIDTKDEIPSTAGGSWLIIFNIVQKLSQNESPFDGTVNLSEIDITSLYPLRHAAGLTREHTFEAAEAGLTLLSKEVSYPSGVFISTLIDPEIAVELYTCFEYNLLVNRILKIIGKLLSDSEVMDETKNIPHRIKKIIIEQLSSYNYLHSEEEVQVSLSDDRNLVIEVNSQKKIRSYPFQLQFSFQI